MKHFSIAVRNRKAAVYIFFCLFLAMWSIVDGAGLSQDIKSMSPREIRQSLQAIKDQGKEVNLWAYPCYTAGQGKGRAILQCPSPVTVGQKLSEFTLIFTAGEEGIRPGGRVYVWFPNGITNPQLKDPDKPGHVTITCKRANESTIDHTWFWATYPQYANDRHLLIVNTYLPKGLAAGETITYRCHSFRVPNHASRWEGGQFRFRIYVDHDSDGYQEEVPEAVWVPKVPAEAKMFMVRVQSTAVTGEKVRLVVTALDRYCNPAIAYRGTVSFSSESRGTVLPPAYQFTEQDAGSHTFPCTFSRAGYSWIKVTDGQNNLVGESNPAEVLDFEPAYRLYWGDIHAHTEMSADAINAAHSFSTYSGSYAAGRYRCRLDFMANTDHHMFEQGNYNHAQWEWMKQVTNNANIPGTFVTLVAVEMSHELGDQNIYFRGDDMPYLEFGDNHPHDLWAFLDAYECMAIPHHFAQSMRPWDWDNYNEKLMVVAEIYSNHGRAEYFENKPAYSYHKISTLKGCTWQDQLARDRKMGCIANSDDHWGRPGFWGLTAVWAKSLTRENIYDGIKARHCYASTNGRAIMHVTVDGAEMGSEIKASRPVTIKAQVACPTEIQEVTIIKNGSDMHVERPLGRRIIDFAWNDTELSDNAYYYVRVRMKYDENRGAKLTKDASGSLSGREAIKGRTGDGPDLGLSEFAWSSPVWVTKE